MMDSATHDLRVYEIEQDKSAARSEALDTEVEDRLNILTDDEFLEAIYEHDFTCAGAVAQAIHRRDELEVGRLMLKVVKDYWRSQIDREM